VYAATDAERAAKLLNVAELIVLRGDDGPQARAIALARGGRTTSGPHVQEFLSGQVLLVPLVAPPPLDDGMQPFGGPGAKRKAEAEQARTDAIPDTETLLANLVMAETMDAVELAREEPLDSSAQAPTSLNQPRDTARKGVGCELGGEVVHDPRHGVRPLLGRCRRRRDDIVVLIHQRLQLEHVGLRRGRLTLDLRAQCLDLRIQVPGLAHLALYLGAQRVEVTQPRGCVGHALDRSSH
jgi:hypothetical protein